MYYLLLWFRSYHQKPLLNQETTRPTGIQFSHQLQGSWVNQQPWFAAQARAPRFIEDYKFGKLYQPPNLSASKDGVIDHLSFSSRFKHASRRTLGLHYLYFQQLSACWPTPYSKPTHPLKHAQ